MKHYSIQLVVYHRLVWIARAREKVDSVYYAVVPSLGANFSNFDFEKLNRMNSNAFSALAVVLVFGFVRLSKGELQKS